MMKPEPLDLIDADNIQILLDTPAWKLVAQRIVLDLDQRRQSLEVYTQSDLDMRFTQGYIAGLRHALSIPQVLIGQARQGAFHER